MAHHPAETFSVPVDGGDLHVARWGSGGPVVLALHGITANLMSFGPIARELGDDVTLVAPDLRGRGGSAGVGGPYSMAAHADDVAAVLDHLGIDRVPVVLGHSMGAFVTVVLGDRHPERVERLILLDGGIPLELPDALLALPTEQLIAAVIGPAMARLDERWASMEEVYDFWKVHPALTASWGPDLEAYVAYDVEEVDGSYRSRVARDAILGDTESQLVRDDIPKALANLRHPTLWVRAPRGLLDGDPLYTDQYAEQTVAEKAPWLRHTLVSDTNHYTIGLGQEGAGATANIIREELAASG